VLTLQTLEPQSALLPQADLSLQFGAQVAGAHLELTHCEVLQSLFAPHGWPRPQPVPVHVGGWQVMLQFNDPHCVPLLQGVPFAHEEVAAHEGGVHP
jgi:hypothetical protein